MIKVICPKCKKTTLIKHDVRYAGKTINFTCSNTLCGNKISHHVEDITTIIGKEIYYKEAELIIPESKHHKKAIFLLREGLQSVGRKSSIKYADYQFETNDMLISRKHFILNGIKEKKSENIRFSIEDNGSKNKVWVNGKELTTGRKLILQNGDRITIGESTILFVYKIS